VRLQATENGFKLDGDLVFASVSDVIDEARNSLNQVTSETVSIDCQSLSKIDSAGLALMVEWKQWCKENQKKLQLTGLSRQAKSLIETYRLQQVL